MDDPARGIVPLHQAPVAGSGLLGRCAARDAKDAVRIGGAQYALGLARVPGRSPGFGRSARMLPQVPCRLVEDFVGGRRAGGSRAAGRAAGARGVAGAGARGRARIAAAAGSKARGRARIAAAVCAGPRGIPRTAAGAPGGAGRGPVHRPVRVVRHSQPQWLKMCP